MRLTREILSISFGIAATISCAIFGEWHLSTPGWAAACLIKPGSEDKPNG